MMKQKTGVLFLISIQYNQKLKEEGCKFSHIFTTTDPSEGKKDIVRSRILIFPLIPGYHIMSRTYFKI